MYVEHLGKEGGEMESVGHTGYTMVGTDRGWVTHVLTNEKVKRSIEKKNIQLVSYKEMKGKS